MYRNVSSGKFLAPVRIGGVAFFYLAFVLLLYRKNVLLSTSCRIQTPMLVVQVVVHKSLLDKSLLPLLADEPTMLPAWDPMGSLAAVGRQHQQQQQQPAEAGQGAMDPRCRI